MRRLPERAALPSATLTRLAAKTTLIAAAPAAGRKALAKAIYDSARSTLWFRRVVDVLRHLSGPGERCMFCSGNECSQVEHFSPKACYPLLAMTWENYLWSCGICNLAKGDSFPPDFGSGAAIINPLDEDVWQYFFIDEFGNLSARYRPDLDALDPRAVTTLYVLDLNRDVLQITRQARLRNLLELIEGALHAFSDGSIDSAALSTRIDVWISEPIQPDVADYFLCGPGKAEPAFAEVLTAAGRD